MLNLRVAKVFAFGPLREGGSASMGGFGRRAPSSPFGVAGPRGDSTATGRRYNLTVSLWARNVLNINNPGPIIGNIESPRFGLANQSFGAGSPGGTGFSEAANNRRLEFQLRFGF
jgi:hypothetical protein